MNLAKEFMRWPFAALGLALLASVSSLGCPVYSDQGGCYSALDCPTGQQCAPSGLCVAGLPYLSRDGGSVGTDASATDDGSVEGSTNDATAKDAVVEVAAGGDGATAAYCGSPNDCPAAET